MVTAREVVEVGSDWSDEEQEVVMAAKEVYKVGDCSEEDIVIRSAADGAKWHFQ